MRPFWAHWASVVPWQRGCAVVLSAEGYSAAAALVVLAELLGAERRFPLDPALAGKEHDMKCNYERLAELRAEREAWGTETNGNHLWAYEHPADARELNELQDAAFEDAEAVLAQPVPVGWDKV